MNTITNKEKLDILERTLSVYKLYIVRNVSTGLCHCMLKAIEEIYGCDFFRIHPLITLRELIPEFNRESLHGTTCHYNSYWWPMEDDYARIKALEYLISIYKQKVLKEQSKSSIKKTLKYHFSFLTNLFKKNK